MYILVVFVGGALLAPWVYWAAQHFADTAPWLADQPFRRYVHRCMLVLALGGMWPLLRSVGARSAKELGLVNPRGQWMRLLQGFLLGFASLAVIVVLTLLFGGREFARDLDALRVLKILGEGALAAVAVGLIEEVLFRGTIFGALRKHMPWMLAALISSAAYGILHFLKRVDDMPADHWYSGLVVLGHMLGGFADWRELIPGFFNLTLAGLLLAIAYQKSGTLYFSIGLHAGWIFWRRAYGALTDVVKVDGTPIPAARDHQWFFGSTTMVDGWLAVIVLVAALIIVLRLPLNAKEQQRQES